MKWVRSGWSFVSTGVVWYGVVTVWLKLETAQVVPASQVWLFQEAAWYLWLITVFAGFNLAISLFHFLVRPTKLLWLSRVLLLAGSVNGLSCLNWAALIDPDNVVVLFQVDGVALVNPAGLTLKRQDVITAVTTAVATALSITPNLMTGPQLQAKLVQFHTTLQASLTDEAVTFTSKADLIAGQLQRLNTEIATWVTEPLPPPVKWTWLAGTAVTLIVFAGFGYLAYQVGVLKLDIVFLGDQQGKTQKTLDEIEKMVAEFPAKLDAATRSNALTPEHRWLLGFLADAIKSGHFWR